MTESTIRVLKHVSLLFAASALALGAASPAFADRDPDDSPISVEALGELFKEVRIYARPALRKAIAKELAEALQGGNIPDDSQIKELPEHQILRIMADFPVLRNLLKEYAAKFPEIDEKDAEQKKARKEFSKQFTELLEKNGLKEKVLRELNLVAPVTITERGGAPSYRNTRFYANHPTILGGKTVAKSNMKQLIIDFINDTKPGEEIAFNVFEFNLIDIAEAMVAAQKRGVKIRGGIHAKLVESSEKVKAVFDLLKKNGVDVYAVNSVGLNHQKMIARLSTTQGHSEVVFSSGNFTQSCIGPEGDLVDVPDGERPKDSLPNANHMIIVESEAIALLVHHELTKTLEMGLRGSEYPLGGLYKFYGEIENGQKENPNVTVAFTPRGGLGDLNRDVIAREIEATKGPYSFVQFAFSSTIIEQALFEKAKAQKDAGKPIDLQIVGDLSFARAEWAVTLAVIGVKVIPIKKGDKSVNVFIEDPSSRWTKLLSKSEMTKLREGVMAPPAAYGRHVYKPPNGDKSLEYEVKVHHKVMHTESSAILGTSFNFSAGAVDGNNEQLLLFRDPEMVLKAQSIFEYLKRYSQGSLYDVLISNDLSFKRWKSEFGTAEMSEAEARTAFEKDLKAAIKDSCSDALKPDQKKTPSDGSEAQIFKLPENRVFAGPVISTVSP